MKGHVYKPGCKCPKDQRCKCGAKWGFLVDVGVNPATGKRKQKFKGGFATRKEAEAAKVSFLAELQTDGFTDLSTDLFSDVAKEWIEWYSNEGGVKPGSVRIRRHQVGCLNSHLAFMRIKDISTKNYQNALNELKKSGLSDNTLSGVHGAARMIFKYSRKIGYIKKDPTEFARVPHDKRTVEKIEGKEELPKYMEKHELALFLKTAQQSGLDRDFEIFSVLAYSGMRVGELLALKWSDVDFENHTISITKTLYNPTGIPSEFELGTPKTVSSIRRISMDKEVLQLLKSLKLRQAEFRLRNPNYFNGNFVCAIMGRERSRGYPDIHTNIGARMKRLIKLSGLSRSFTPHTFRHTHTSLLAEIKTPLEVIMERLGHSDDKITRMIYLHVTEPLKKEAVQGFSDLMSALR